MGGHYIRTGECGNVHRSRLLPETSPTEVLKNYRGNCGTFIPDLGSEGGALRKKGKVKRWWNKLASKRVKPL